MYTFIKILFHTNPLISHVAYLYQDNTTHKYYLSNTQSGNEDAIDYSTQYMLIDNKPKITKQPYLKNINIIAEVTENDFRLNQINNYKL